METLKEAWPEFTSVPSIGNNHDLSQIREQAFESVIHDIRYPLSIWDRARFISEYVYNPILKSRPLAFDTSTWLKLLSVYLGRPQLLIYCRIPLWKVRESFHQREQLDSVVHRLVDLDHAYQTVMDFLLYAFKAADNGSKLIEYDYTVSDLGYIGVAVNRYKDLRGVV